MFIKYTEVTKVEFEISNEGLRKMREDIGYRESDPVTNESLIEDWIADDGVDGFIHEYHKYITNIKTNNDGGLTIREEHE